MRQFGIATCLLVLGAAACAHQIPYSKGIADLVSPVSDPNGFKLNPYWQAQVQYPDARPSIKDLCRIRIPFLREITVDALFTQPQCTTQGSLISIDKLRELRHLECYLGAAVKPPNFSGHLNWFAATVHGIGSWLHVEGSDHDANLLLTPDAVGPIVAPGLTSKLPKRHLAYKLEFDSREVFEPMAAPGVATPIWHQVLTDRARRDALLDDKRYIAIGLYGLDAVHGYHAELHPVWGLAVRTDEGSSAESWILFARNSGNEGGCSSGIAHPVPFQPGQPAALTFDLPLRTRPNEPTHVSLFRNTLGAVIAVTPAVITGSDGKRVLRVTLPLTVSPNGTAPIVQGEIHITYPRD